jgi:hypothetical protein
MPEPQWNNQFKPQQKFDMEEFSMFAPPPMGEESQATSAPMASGSINDSELLGFGLGFQFLATAPYPPDANLSFNELWSLPFLHHTPELGEGFFQPYSMDPSSTLMHYDSSLPSSALTSGMPGPVGHGTLPFPPHPTSDGMLSEPAYGVTYVLFIYAATLLIRAYNRYDDLVAYLTNGSGLGDELLLHDVQF